MENKRKGVKKKTKKGKSEAKGDGARKGKLGTESKRNKSKNKRIRVQKNRQGIRTR